MDFAGMMAAERLRRAAALAAPSAAAPEKAPVATPERAACKTWPTFEPGSALVRDATLAKSGWNEAEDVLRVGEGGSTLGDVFYVADFVDEQTERDMLAQTDCEAAQWTVLKSRRLQCYGPGQEAGPLPPWLADLAQALVDVGVFPEALRPNHALLNDYEPGQGILGHTDGPCYHPLVACLSLASSAVLRFSERLRPADIGERPPRALGGVLLRPRSLVVFQGAAYEHALHAVDPTPVDVLDETVGNLAAADGVLGATVARGRRISITMRYATQQEVIAEG